MKIILSIWLILGGSAFGSDELIPKGAKLTKISCALKHSSKHVWWKPWEEISKKFQDTDANWIAPSRVIIRGRNYKACTRYQGTSYLLENFNITKPECFAIEALSDGAAKVSVHQGFGQKKKLLEKIIYHARYNKFPFCLKTKGTHKLLITHKKPKGGKVAGIVASLRSTDSNKVVLRTTEKTKLYLLTK